MEDEVLLKQDGAVAEIILNRPAKMNAVTPAMSAAIEQFCRQLDRDDHVRVVLLRGRVTAPSVRGAISTRWRTIRQPGSFATVWNTRPLCGTCASQ